MNVNSNQGSGAGGAIGTQAQANLHNIDEVMRITQHVSLSVSRYASNTDTECIGALETLKAMAKTKAEVLVLMTDSQVLVRHLANEFDMNCSIKVKKQLAKILRQILYEGKRVEILWIPGHAGFAMNEAADANAEAGASRSDYENHHDCPWYSAPYSACKRKIAMRITRDSIRMWQERQDPEGGPRQVWQLMHFPATERDEVKMPSREQVLQYTGIAWLQKAILQERTGYIHTNDSADKGKPALECSAHHCLQCNHVYCTDKDYARHNWTCSAHEVAKETLHTEVLKAINTSRRSKEATSMDKAQLVKLTAKIQAHDDLSLRQVVLLHRGVPLNRKLSIKGRLLAILQKYFETIGYDKICTSLRGAGGRVVRTR